jgi:protein-tyrosine phosphatase
VRACGLGLLIAHPERARGFLAGGFALLRDELEAGALLQVNVSSLLGDHGPRARETASTLVRGGRAYCLASDTHPGTRERTLPLAGAALRRLGVSDVQALRLTQSNPRFLLREGDPRLDAREQVMVGPKSCGRGTGGPGSSGDCRRAEPQPRTAGTD